MVREEACRALGRVGRPEDATVLARIMTADTSGDCRVAAIEALGALKAPDPRIEALLVEGMEHRDPGIRLASVQALQAITGQDLGVDAGPWRKPVQSRRRRGTSGPGTSEDHGRARLTTGRCESLPVIASRRSLLSGPLVPGDFLLGTARATMAPSRTPSSRSVSLRTGWEWG